MYSVEVKDILHQGWPDPEWVKGFEVTIEPPVTSDLSGLQEVMSATDLEGVDDRLTRVTFDRSFHEDGGSETRIYAMGEGIQHYGMLRSAMNAMARESLEARLGVLLVEEIRES